MQLPPRNSTKKKVYHINLINSGAVWIYTCLINHRKNFAFSIYHRNAILALVLS